MWIGGVGALGGDSVGVHPGEAVDFTAITIRPAAANSYRFVSAGGRHSGRDRRLAHHPMSARRGSRAVGHRDDDQRTCGRGVHRMTRRREALPCPGQLALPIFDSTALLADAGRPAIEVLARPRERAAGPPLDKVCGGRVAVLPTEAPTAHATAVPSAVKRGRGTASPQATVTDASMRGASEHCASTQRTTVANSQRPGVARSSAVSSERSIRWAYSTPPSASSAPATRVASTSPAWPARRRRAAGVGSDAGSEAIS